MSNAVTATDRAPGNITEFPIQRDLPTATSLSDEDDYLPDVFDAAETPAETRAGAGVAWARTDRHSSCYSHLLEQGKDQLSVAKLFEFGKAEMELLIALNRYDPRGKDDIIAFGLRGARLRGKESFEEVATLPLEDVRPDHLNFRCVVGYYFRSRGKFSAFTGSTVPWQGYMAAGTIKYNLLSPGCYIYKKGTHMPVTRSRWVTPALRLSDADGAHSGAATVLRNKRDLVFELTDTWDHCTPADNIHCAYSNSKFSSLGCQTIKGGMTDGLWAVFASTLRKLPESARVDYLLFTGAEASMAASLVSSGHKATDPNALQQLGRLRVGSGGDEVKRLQERLGETKTGYFGPATKKKLVDFQVGNGIAADGVYSPALDLKLGWAVLAEHFLAAPVAVAVQTSTQPIAATLPAQVPAISAPAAEQPSSAVNAALSAHAVQQSAAIPESVMTTATAPPAHESATLEMALGSDKLMQDDGGPMIVSRSKQASHSSDGRVEKQSRWMMLFAILLPLIALGAIGAALVLAWR